MPDVARMQWLISSTDIARMQCPRQYPANCIAWQFAGAITCGSIQRPVLDEPAASARMRNGGARIGARAQKQKLRRPPSTPDPFARTRHVAASTLLHAGCRSRPADVDPMAGLSAEKPARGGAATAGCAAAKLANTSASRRQSGAARYGATPLPCRRGHRRHAPPQKAAAPLPQVPPWSPKLLGRR